MLHDNGALLAIVAFAVITGLMALPSFVAVYLAERNERDQ